MHGCIWILHIASGMTVSAWLYRVCNGLPFVKGECYVTDKDKDRNWQKFAFCKCCSILYTEHSIMFVFMNMATMFH